MKKYFVNYLPTALVMLMIVAFTSCRNDRNNTNSDPYTREGTYDRTDPLNEENGPVAPGNNNGTSNTDRMETQTGRMDDTTSTGNHTPTGTP